MNTTNFYLSLIKNADYTKSAAEEPVNVVRKSYQSRGATAKEILKSVGIATALGAGLGLGAYGLGSMVDYAHRKISEKRNFRRMLQEFPELKKHEVKVKKIFDTIHTYAPELTNSPLVAGSWVKKIMEVPEAGISPQSIKELIEAQSRLADIRTAQGSLGGVLRNAAHPAIGLMSSNIWI